jgi:hypothetical protein
MHKHFVRFFSPGSFFDETSEFEMNSWDVSAALAMSKTVVERYGATPFAFRFFTRSRGPDDLDSSITATSKRYWLGGTIYTLADIIARNDPSDSILISNMKCNRWSHVIENNNSWKIVKPFDPERDEVLEL